ncbi:MAG TPA: histidine phosphatase family protein [Allosphingosinicella sp.]|nr:histidine phosphatase family protein [Allosphingosinicella sp.]
MKTLTLLRHAKSSWADPGQSDFERPLNARGRKAARAMGREMRRLGLGFDLILASPAVRVVETLNELAQGYGAAAPTVQDERIYLAAPDTLLALLRAVSDETERLLLAGHNPGLALLALGLGRPGGLHDLIAAKYPTGALTELHLGIGRWADLALGEGELVRFVRPRDLEEG